MSGEERILAAISELKVGQEAMQKDMDIMKNKISGLEAGQQEMQKDMDIMKNKVNGLEAGQETMQRQIIGIEIGQKATAKEFANIVKVIGSVRAELKQDISDNAFAIQKDLKNFKSETNRNFKLVDTRFELLENQMDRKFNEFEGQMNKNFNAFKNQIETRCNFFENQIETRLEGFTNNFGTKLEDGFKQVNERIDNLILGGVDYILKTNDKIKILEQQVKLA